MAVQTKFRQGRLYCLLAELGWTWLLGCLTFSLLTLAIHGINFLIWSLFS
jgi:hypothetical protein